MSETNCATGGFRRITRLGPPVKFRLVGFGLVLVCGGLLLTWISHSAWDHLDHLQKEHAAVSTESFYLGVTLRSTIRGLNEKLVQFGRLPEASTREDFFREATTLERLLATNRHDLVELAKLPLLKQVLIDDFDILDKIRTEFGRYVAHAAQLLSLTNGEPGDLSFEDRYNQVRQAAAPLLKLCDALVKAQREDFTDFLGETQANLVSHQRLLKLTLALVITLAGTLAILTYRGMIAPLRVELSQSKTIIERQEKLASLGVLASGVAHEIRNPLTAIKFRLFSLKKTVPVLSSNEDATIIGDEIDRLERIVKDFLGFARPSEPELVSIPAEKILKDAQEFLKGQLERSGIQLKFEAQETVWVHADPQQVKQVLINLIQNAAEAIGSNGEITLSLRRDTIELDGQAKPAAILAVADTGKGIPPEVEARLFDPFFSTKEGGTGLGLAIAARIVEKHGGVLRYETEVNRGTTFEVVLPQIETDAITNSAHRG